MDDSRIRSKTAPFSFENGLVCTGPELFLKLFHIQSKEIGNNMNYEETTEIVK